MTLVEVVIGIGIIMSILMISFPKEKSQRYEIDSFARQLVGDIRYVRSMNSNGNLSIYLQNIISKENPRYVIKENDNVFEVKILNNKVVAKKSNDEAEFKLSINYLSQMAFEYADINQILFLENIEVTDKNKKAIDLLRSIFNKKENYINEYV